MFFHKNFEFKNGDIGEKLLVLLNTPQEKSELYLFCKTTSNPNRKPTRPGCHPSISLFFIPEKKECFPRDTWLQLFDITPADAASVLQDYWQKYLIEKGRLTDLCIKQLMNCVKLIEDIEEEYKNLILRN